MIGKLASKVAFILNGASEDSDLYELYCYGLECILNEVITDCLVLAIGFVFQVSIQVFIWICIFTICRINMGGWHAPNHAICISCSVLASLTPILMYKTLQVTENIFIYLLLLLFYLVWTMIKLPLQTSRHIVSLQRRIFAKITDICIIFLLFFSIIISGCISPNIFFAYFALSEAIALTLHI